MSAAPHLEIAITGAFSYTGKYLAPLLLSRGHKIRTLTNHPDSSNPLIYQIRVAPYRFDEPEKLAASLAGCDVLVNTYWVRFPHGTMTFERAVANTLTLIDAAKSAGVRRIVHVSIANASLDSPLAYYSGKARLEEAVRNSSLSFAILRPTVIFGREDILINNIAWFVRRFPVFAVPGSGLYGVQPIFVGDMAALLADAAERIDDYAIDAVGPKLTPSTISSRSSPKPLAVQRASCTRPLPSLTSPRVRWAGFSATPSSPGKSIAASWTIFSSRATFPPPTPSSRRVCHIVIPNPARGSCGMAVRDLLLLCT